MLIIENAEKYKVENKNHSQSYVSERTPVHFFVYWYGIFLNTISIVSLD